MSRELATVLVIVATAWAAVTLWATPNSRTVERYCAYGSVSLAQYDGCRENTTAGQVDDLDTNAARYARENLDRCLEDAGPLCSDADTEPLIDPAP